MDAENPVMAQKIVSEYAALLEQHDRDDVYPAPLDTLPYPKETIKTAIRTAAAALISTGQLTDELRDFLEVAYISLADYVDAELVRLLGDYRAAGADLASGPRLGERQGGLAGLAGAGSDGPARRGHRKDDCPGRRGPST